MPESAAKLPGFDHWDSGRLSVHPDFADLLRRHGLTTCAAFLDCRLGESVRRVGTRETLRLTLAAPEGARILYLKRHGKPRWRDRIMPWLHFSRPIHGARNEWNAIRNFAAAGIPTMTPVAFGESESGSFLVTEAVPSRCNLLEYIGGRVDGAHRLPVDAFGRRDSIHSHGGPSSVRETNDLRPIIDRVAAIARCMHSSGFHHQDFYLNHLLLGDNETGPPDIRVIDLGRVRRRTRLSRRWIVKDLAQLDFSAGRLSCRDRLRFLRSYLGRPLKDAERALIRSVTRKSRRIAAHTRKHRL